MFVYSLRASTIKFFGIVCVSLALLITLIAFVPTYTNDSEATINEVEEKTEKVKTNAERVKFIESLGYKVEEKSIEETEVTIPENFDRIYLKYNDMQVSCGYNLNDYKGKTVKRYTYKILNYEEYDKTVYINLLVYKNKIIGGDICSAELDGFAKGLSK